MANCFPSLGFKSLMYKLTNVDSVNGSQSSSSATSCGSLLKLGSQLRQQPVAEQDYPHWGTPSSPTTILKAFENQNHLQVLASPPGSRRRCAWEFTLGGSSCVKSISTPREEKKKLNIIQIEPLKRQMLGTEGGEKNTHIHTSRLMVLGPGCLARVCLWLARPQ